MNSKASKSVEKRLERKRADLQAALENRKKIDGKIHELKDEIEKLQSAQLEQVFHQVKKSILKEGLRVDAETIPDILQMLRSSQDGEGVVDADNIEPVEGTASTSSATDNDDYHSEKQGVQPDSSYVNASHDANRFLP